MTAKRIWTVCFALLPACSAPNAGSEPPAQSAAPESTAPEPTGTRTARDKTGTWGDYTVGGYAIS